jgi:hypothetical protein
MSVPVGIRIAAILLWFDGLGFGIPAVIAIRNLAAHKDIPFIMGFPAYGRGFFERHGLKTTIPLLVAFLLVNIGEIAAGVLLWSGHRSGAILGYALLPFGAVFWLGFDLPIPPAFGVVRSILTGVWWSSLG